jgi:hypothetical protein
MEVALEASNCSGKARIMELSSGYWGCVCEVLLPADGIGKSGGS